MAGRQINKEMAQKIVRKLRAQVVKSDGAHDIAYFYHKGQLIAHFGIRRGSNREQGHDHIPADLHISPRQAKDLARCPLSLKAFVAILVEKDVIEATDEDEAAEGERGAEAEGENEGGL